MSWLSSLLPFVKSEASDVAATVKAISDKAAADIAKVRSSAAVTAAVADVDTRLRSLDTLVADYRAKLQADRVKAAAVKAPVLAGPSVGANGATGSAPTIGATGGA